MHKVIAIRGEQEMLKFLDDNDGKIKVLSMSRGTRWLIVYKILPELKKPKRKPELTAIEVDNDSPNI